MKKKDILQNLKCNNVVWLIQHQKMNMYKYVLVLRSKSKFFKDHKIAWATKGVQFIVFEKCSFTPNCKKDNVVTRW